MVFKNSFKKDGGQQLLNARKRSEDVPRQRRPKLGKRLSAIFKKPNDKHHKLKGNNKNTGGDDLTPPSSPGDGDGPISVKVVTAAYPTLHSPSRHDEDDERSYAGTAISDLSASVQRAYVKRKSCKEAPIQEIDEELATIHTATPTKSAVDKSGKSATTSTIGENQATCSPDAVVAGLFGLTDVSCFVFQCGQSSCIANERPSSDTLSRATGNTYPAWGTPPSDDEDDDNDSKFTNLTSTIGGPRTVGSLFTEDKRELHSQGNDTFKETSILEEEELSTDTADTPTSPYRCHENFELILDPAALKNGPYNAPKRKALDWMRNKTSLVQEKKNEKNDVVVSSRQLESVAKMPPLGKRLPSRNTTKEAAAAAVITKPPSILRNNNVKETAKLSPIPEKKPNFTKKWTNSKQVLTGGASQLTDELLGEGELLGEEILEENEGSVLSATYTEMANMGSIVGIHQSAAASEIDEVLKATETENLERFEKTLETCAEVNESRSRSWNVLTKALAKCRTKSEQKKEDKGVGRTVSSPMRIPYDAKNEAKKTPSSTPTNMWKTADDPGTGRTYYYHKLTRKTTWSKPANYDALIQQERELRMSVRTNSGKVNEFQDHNLTRVPSDIVIATDLSAENQKKIDAGESLAASRDANEPILKRSFQGDSDRRMAGKKLEIARLLAKMAPPDDGSIVKLMDQYQGREDELLVQLRDLVKISPKPFDEPAMKTTLSFASDMSDPDAKSISKARTANTSNTGVTEKTQRIKNTAKPRYVFEAIKESDEPHEGESISINNLSTLTEPVSSPDRSESIADFSESPSRKTTERTRDLLVEEFNSGRLNVENYDKQANLTAKTARQRKMDAKRSLRGQDPNKSAPSSEETQPNAPSAAYSIASEYSGDGVDSDIETFTDTVSALSSLETGFDNRKDNFDKARRLALDDAIRRRDWELAASVTENIRHRSTASSCPSDQYEDEWTQSELDKFISENDWDAVATYIAQMRDTGKAHTRKFPANEEQHRVAGGKQALGDADTNIQKRFGARSQLQHAEDEHSLSSWESESFYESDDASTSASSASLGDIHRMVRKEFAC